jgi:hypothetical protein
MNAPGSGRETIARLRAAEKPSPGSENRCQLEATPGALVTALVVDGVAER